MRFDTLKPSFTLFALAVAIISSICAPGVHLSIITTGRVCYRFAVRCNPSRGQVSRAPLFLLLGTSVASDS